MSSKGAGAVAPILLAAAFITGCNSAGEKTSGTAGRPANASEETAKTSPPSSKLNPDGTIPSGTGVEKEKPEAGKGNVQGKVFYNERPAAGVEVQLCETFSRFVGGCGGETFKTKTDANGEYLLSTDRHPGS